VHLSYVFVRCDRFTSAKDKGHPKVALTRFGGGGGNRTRVRKPYTDSSTYLASSFDLVADTPPGRLINNDPLNFRDVPRGATHPYLT
jgi:hypothetical protein